MPSFTEIIKKVLENEGGYVDDPDDPGGETNFGISKRSYPDLDIKNLTKEKAIEIYKKDYWFPSKAQTLPQDLRYHYFDMVVNAGQKSAVKALQMACGAVVDGRIGSETIEKAQWIHEERLKAYRVLYYANLVLNKPELSKYWFGWFRRGTK